MADPVFARKILAQVQLGNALADVYAPPSQPPNGVATLNGLWIANTDTVAHTITLRLGSGTLTVANSLLEAVSIPANTTWAYSGSEWALHVPFGWHLQGLADVASMVTVTVSGAEVS